MYRKHSERIFAFTVPAMVQAVASRRLSKIAADITGHIMFYWVP
jgi:hypothetical protein